VAFFFFTKVSILYRFIFMKIAIVHDYLHQYGGAEKVVEKWLEMYPDADVYTSFYTPEKFESSQIYEKARIEGRIHTTWLQSVIPRIIKFYKHLFWLYPIVMSFLVVKGYDVVLISSTYCAKNVRYKGCKKIIHYCHSPVRFLHNLVTETDHKSINPVYRIIIPFLKAPLKWMDLKAVAYLNKNECIWIANSEFIKETIKQVYDTDSIVIYPPIELSKYLHINRNSNEIQDYYLCHGRISFHKRLDLAINSCLVLGKKLKISGSSSFAHEMDTLKKIVTDFESAHPESKGLVEFLGRTTDDQVIELITHCKAFLFPGKEDFGITPIEMLAGGVPLIAYKAGGALEYVQDGVNGVFFPDQTVESMTKVIQEFETTFNQNPKNIKKTSLPFDEKTFRKQISDLI
jgi:glycosyltransferase involved in cell wall biosynthesis